MFQTEQAPCPGKTAWGAALEVRLEEHYMKQRFGTALMVSVLAMLPVWLGSVAAWEPQKPVELVIPAGPGGGADVMARFIAPLISKHNLSPQPASITCRHSRLSPSISLGALAPKAFSTSRASTLTRTSLSSPCRICSRLLWQLGRRSIGKT